jgi:hypothetical protein
MRGLRIIFVILALLAFSASASALSLPFQFGSLTSFPTSTSIGTAFSSPSFTTSLFSQPYFPQDEDLACTAQAIMPSLFTSSTQSYFNDDVRSMPLNIGLDPSSSILKGPFGS